MNARQINSMISNAEKAGNGVYANDLLNSIGMTVSISDGSSVRIIRAKTVSGETKVRSINGDWFRVGVATHIEAREVMGQHLPESLNNLRLEVRDIAQKIDRYEYATLDHVETKRLRDAADLLRVLAHIVDGRSIREAFGAPGDWGYNTPIGAGLWEFYQARKG